MAIGSASFLPLLGRIYGGEGFIPRSLTTFFSDTSLSVTTEEISAAVTGLGHVTIREEPERLVSAVRAKAFAAPTSVTAVREASRMADRPYPLPASLPFDIRSDELLRYCDPKKSEKILVRDRQKVAERFEAASRSIPLRGSFPPDDVFYDHIARLLRHVWTTLCGLDAATARSRFDDILKVHQLYMSGVVADPRKFKARWPAEEVLRDFCMFRMASALVNELEYHRMRMLTLHPLTGRPPALLVPPRYEDCRIHLFRVHGGFRSVKPILKQRKIPFHKIQAAHGFTERLLAEHYRPVAPDDAYRINDLVVFPGDRPGYFFTNGPAHVARVVFVEESGECWVEDRWGIVTHPVVHKLEDTLPEYGSIAFIARPKDHIAIHEPRETFAEAGYRIPQPPPPSPGEVLEASQRMVLDLRGRDLDWISEHF